MTVLTDNESFVEWEMQFMSNTATPKYYGEFRQKVWDGLIPICKEIEMEMHRIDKRIDDPDIWYDPDAVEGWIAFCENEMTLTNGDKLDLLDTFKLWGEQIFGWYVFEEEEVWRPYEDGLRKGGEWVVELVKKRLINKQYLIVARGAAKSLYESLVQAYFLVCDPTTTQGITTAPTMKQAEEVMQSIRTAVVRAPGPVFQFMTMGSAQNTTGNRALRQKLYPSKRGIENMTTNSFVEVRPMTIDKLQGLRSKINTVDEWLSGEVRENVIAALEQGASKIPDWLIMAVSSEGTVRNSVGDSIKMELLDILHGDLDQPETSIFYYKLDDVKEVSQPEMWPKAQPNIGKTVTWQIYHREVKRAEKVLSQRNEILAKRFGLPMEGFTHFFTYEETICHPSRSFDGMPCSLGWDLSQGDDFCAFTVLIPLARGKFGIKTRSYISQLTLDKLSGSMRVLYQDFIREGTLIVMRGNVLDMDEVFDDMHAWLDEHQYDVRCVGYDPYNSKRFLERWTQIHGEYAVEKVIQGARTESVPLGELKKLADVKRDDYGRIVEGGRLVFDQSLMHFGMGNAMTKTDINGNQMLVKRRHEEKIDNVSALMDAYVAWTVHKDAF